MTDPSTPDIRRFSLSALTSEPWRNGGGVTRTVAVGGGADAWTWRISIADVARDGPFSIFLGCDRHLALIEGSGIALRGDRSARLTEVGAIVSFRGDDAYDASLIDGPVRVWNLMVKRQTMWGLVQCRSGSIEGFVQPGTLVTCAFIIAGAYRLETPHADDVPLHVGDGVFFEPAIETPRLSTSDAEAAVLLTQVASIASSAVSSSASEAGDTQSM